MPIVITYEDLLALDDRLLDMVLQDVVPDADTLLYKGEEEVSLNP